jgi:hypothetical protein
VLKLAWHAEYASNGRFINHCLVAFLRRIADPDALNLEPMLYQVQLSAHATSYQQKTHVSLPG